MEEFPSNSKHPTKKEVKNEPKKVEKVVTGEVVQRKKPLGKRFAETFVAGDDAKTVWEYVVMDVLVPAAKDTLADAVSQGVERILFGEARSTSRRTGGRPNGYVSYQNRYSAAGGRHPATRDEPRRDPSRRARASHEFAELVIQTRAEAEEVIDRLFDLTSKYETATVADLYELLGVTGQYTDDKWGWSDLRGAGVVRVTGGYILDLPKPEPLNA